MKFVLNSSLLSQRLQLTGRVITAKNSLPILNNFLFEIEEQKLRITASDNESTLKTTIELIESEQDIRFTVNAKTIQDAMKEIPDQPLEFFVGSNLDVTIQYQGGHYNFMAQPADEYPVTPEMPSDASRLTVGAELLYEALGRAIFATANDPLRPVMNGVFFDIASNNATVVATDAQKLTCNKILNTQASKEGAFILPKKPAGLLKNVLQKETGDVRILFNERNADVYTENFEMTCRLIEGKFPNYSAVIPKDNPNIVTVNRDALMATLRRVLIFSGAASTLVKLQLSPSKLTISSQDIDFAMSAEESLLCEYSGNPMSIGFKGPSLLEIINNIQGEDVIVRLADASRAGVIIPAEQKENEEVQMILMPLMLPD